MDLNRSCASATNARTRSAAGKWPVDTGEKVVSIATYSLGRRHLCTPLANSEPRLTKRHRKTYSIWPNFVTIKSTVIRARAGFDIGILVPWLFQGIENAAFFRSFQEEIERPANVSERTATEMKLVRRLSRLLVCDRGLTA